MTGIAPLAEAAVRQSAGEVVAGLGLRSRPAPAGRPRVVAAMIGSADGRAAVAGRSVGLGHPEDRALLRGLRASADAVLVGAATVRAERYANLFDDGPGGRIAIVTRSGDVPWETGLFAEPATRIAIYTAAAVEVPAGVAADVEVRAAATPGEALADLCSRDGAELVLCEGGPRLLREVAAAGLLDDLVLTVAPLLAAGEAPGALTGPPLDPPARMALAGVWRAEDHVFLHYTS
jgi:riboflavin biosynthesis pyrimidine reductase